VDCGLDKESEAERKKGKKVGKKDGILMDVVIVTSLSYGSHVLHYVANYI